MTTKFEMTMSRTLTYIFAGCCLVLSYFVYIKIDTAKFEIIQSLKASNSTRDASLSGITDTLMSLRKDFDARGEWMKSIDSEMARRADVRMDRQEFIQWCRDTQKLNPSLNVPALNAIAETQEQIECDE